MVYTTPTKVRKLTADKLTVAKITDADLTEIISQATVKVNSEINVKIKEELVKYLDSWRENKYTDGSTTTFYVRKGVTNYLGDVNNDGEVDENDVRVYKLDSDNVRTELTVSSVDVEDGSFTLSSAPGTDTQKLTVNYDYTFYNVNTPDKIIELLTGYLAASWAYLSIEHGLSGNTKFGNISFSRPLAGTSANRYYDQYEKLLGRAQIPGLKPRIGTSKSRI